MKNPGYDTVNSGTGARTGVYFGATYKAWGQKGNSSELAAYPVHVTFRLVRFWAPPLAVQLNKVNISAKPGYAGFQFGTGTQNQVYF